MAVGKACGKFILLGEHFVISGAPALAFPLRELHCEVRIKEAKQCSYIAKFPNSNSLECSRWRSTVSIQGLMEKAIDVTAEYFGCDLKRNPLEVWSQSLFPISRGFGSSAGFAVATARAFAQYREKNLDSNELSEVVMRVETIFHGRPSGVDSAVILNEKPIRYEVNRSVQRIQNYAVDFIAVDSGPRQSCAELVKRIGEQRDRFLNTVRELVDVCEHALIEGTALGVSQSVTASHEILQKLELSTPAIENIIQTSKSFGVLAGKVSGAGAGGAVILVAPKFEGRAIVQKLKDQGMSVIAIEEAQRI